jgi:hypothetical protein
MSNITPAHPPATLESVAHRDRVEIEVQCQGRTPPSRHLT